MKFANCLKEAEDLHADANPYPVRLDVAMLTPERSWERTSRVCLSCGITATLGFETVNPGMKVSSPLDFYTGRTVVVRCFEKAAPLWSQDPAKVKLQAFIDQQNIDQISTVHTLHEKIRFYSSIAAGTVAQHQMRTTS